jgi:YD repeat-containing protein
MQASTQRYNFNLTFAPNGDVLTSNDSANGNWTYGYDDFNRLLSANATGQSYTITTVLGTAGTRMVLTLHRSVLISIITSLE